MEEKPGIVLLAKQPFLDQWKTKASPSSMNGRSNDFFNLMIIY